jgi:hypothetical protein
MGNGMHDTATDQCIWNGPYAEVMGQVEPVTGGTGDDAFQSSTHYIPAHIKQSSSRQENLEFPPACNGRQHSCIQLSI